MYVVTVIPIIKSTGVEELTYYSRVEYPIGSFIQVPVRGKERGALVASCVNVEHMRTSVRKKNFTLQKIQRQKVKKIVTKEFIRACERVARLYALTTGVVLDAVIPKVLHELTCHDHDTLCAEKPKLRGFIVPRIYQGLSDNRIEFYRTAIREAFAAKSSVFIATPTVTDAERVYDALVNGIDSYAFVVHQKMSKKVLKERLVTISTINHPVAIIGPATFLAIPRVDLATIIIERENSPLYHLKNKKHIDLRILLHELATELGGQLFLADLPVSVESIYLRENNEYEEVVTGHHRMHFPTHAEIVNVQGGVGSAPKPFRALETKLLEEMRLADQRQEHIFLYVARRGLSPITLCRDCGTVVTCNECDASVVLHKGSTENYFLCHSCGSLRHARERCVHCKSWRLEMYGVGAELVEREVRAMFPLKQVYILSSDTAKTHLQAKKIIHDFYATPSSILIGTEMALPYLQKQVPLVGVVSIDSLLSLASWNMYERIASTLTRLREISSEQLLLQTRKPETDILRTVLSGNFSTFYRSELKVRKKFGYPPFSVIIKISITGTQEENIKKIEEVKEYLHPYELVSFPRFLKAPGGKCVVHGFLRIARENWPDDELIERLKLLPPSYVVTINPDTVL